MRWKQVIGSIDELLTTVKNPEALPLFLEHADAMLEDPCVAHCAAEENPRLALWRIGMREHNPFRTKGTKCMPGRFMDVVRRIIADNQGRAQRKFWYTHCCLELDMLSSGKVKKLVLKDAGVSEKAQTTSSKVVSAEEKAVRATMANQMVMGLLSYSLPDAERKDKTLGCIFDVWSRWQGTHNIAGRTVEGRRDWLKKELDGGFVRTLCSIWENLDDQNLMRKCDFILPTPAWTLQDNEPTLAEVQKEDDAALIFVKLQVGMIFFRVRRLLPQLLGWNSRSVLFIANDERAKREFERMMLDVAHTQTFKANQKVPDIKDIVDRNICDTTSVQQTIAIAKLLTFDGKADATTDAVDDQHKCMDGSQAIEDGFNNLKNVKSNTPRIDR